MMQARSGSIFGGLSPDHQDYQDYDYPEVKSAPSLPIGTNRVEDDILKQMAKMPLLTTEQPKRLKNMPKTNLGIIGSLLVHSSMDIVDQTRMFSNMDPHHVQFIAPPPKNAGRSLNTIYICLLCMPY